MTLQASKLLKMHTCNTQLDSGMVSDPPVQLKERMCRIKAKGQVCPAWDLKDSLDAYLIFHDANLWSTKLNLQGGTILQHG